MDTRRNTNHGRAAYAQTNTPNEARQTSTNRNNSNPQSGLLARIISATDEFLARGLNLLCGDDDPEEILRYQLEVAGLHARYNRRNPGRGRQGQQGRPIRQAPVPKLSLREITADDQDEEDGEAICCVCQKDIKVGTIVTFLPNCRHWFCTDCLKPWVKKHDTCPCPVVVDQDVPYARKNWSSEKIQVMPPRATAKAIVLMLVTEAPPSDGIGPPVADGVGEVQEPVPLVPLVIVALQAMVGVVDIMSVVEAGSSVVVAAGEVVAADVPLEPQYSEMKEVTSLSLTEPSHAATTELLIEFVKPRGSLSYIPALAWRRGHCDRSGWVEQHGTARSSSRWTKVVEGSEIDSYSGSARSKRSSGGSFQLVVSSHNRASGRLRQIFPYVDPDVLNENEEGDEAREDEQKRSMWLGRVNSYNRMMHAHTMYQMEGKTMPGYKKTLHAFASPQNQEDVHGTASKSETSSPHLGARRGVWPSPVSAQLSQLTIDDAPIPPANSPSPEQQHVHRPPSIRGLKPRRATEPVPRDFAQGRSEGKKASSIRFSFRQRAKPTHYINASHRMPQCKMQPNKAQTKIVINGTRPFLLMPDASYLFWPALFFDEATTEPPILMAAKYIRKEASPMYYGNIQWYFRIPDGPGFFELAVEKWRSVVALCGPRPFTSFQVWFPSESFHLEHVLEEVYALVKLIHDTGFEPDPKYVPGDGVRPEVKARSIASGRRLFNTGRKRGAASILGRAVALGRRARAENWSQEKLAERFSTFVKVARSKNKKWPDGL
ncbi:uncharacterized protein MYCFIDRAFT_79974 [Pseudocercospora fijiensis CIRAD86]|uniref:RING-type domain-containing protein n=1 Tax=Pseudocercospora fijiensis (strain CIRAD86) TaxID=383855 RepID=N1Q7H0_PSEFD|nr:uncharacterized protein MYCFIDRAFT_79974 [Pseudocercospora fijiensis CIRAD86]EME88620.1 hypothetical protein MYCFIDRAFT_79974 [Pseudocercospora fijiensis CIRAD86]